jgi:hypothetical protein
MKTLTKEHQAVSLLQTAPDAFEIDGQTGSWRALNNKVFASSSYFDLAGMSQREKTMFFEAATVQELYSPIHVDGQVGDNIVVFDIMTSEPMNDAELLSFAASGNFATSQAGLGYQETIYARVRHYLVDLDTASWGTFILGTENQLGSLEATASDRIYTYRMVYVVKLNTSFSIQGKITVYYARHIIRAEAKEEADYRYLMRLRRSYELQQSYDED